MHVTLALSIFWLTAVGASVGISLLIVDVAGDGAAYTAPVIGTAVVWVVGATGAINSLSGVLAGRARPPGALLM